MAELASWQLPSRDFLLAGEGHVGLFDEPPKTYPAIDAAIKRGGEHLFIVPAYLIDNWVDEIEQLHPGTAVAAAQGTPDQKHRAIRNTDAQIILASYRLLGMTKRGLAYKELIERTWAGVVFDESHRMRGRASQSTWQHHYLRTPTVNYVSATPIIVSGGDIWPHLHRREMGGAHKHYKGCHGREVGGYWPFCRRWCKIDVTAFGETVGLVRPELQGQFIQEILAPWSMRRWAKDIPELADLDSFEWVLRHHPPPGWLKVYRQFKKDWKTAQGEAVKSGGALVHKTRAMTADPASGKLECLLGLLEDRPTKKATVWCWYRDTAALLVRELTRAGYKPFLITGDAKIKRHEVVKAFNATSVLERPVLVTTIEALKEGENVQSSSLAVFYEGHYIAPFLQQCLRRHVRYGQTERVEVVWMVTTGTVDERVYRIAKSGAGHGTEMELVAAILNEP